MTTPPQPPDGEPNPYGPPPGPPYGPPSSGPPSPGPPSPGPPSYGPPPPGQPGYGYQPPAAPPRRFRTPMIVIGAFASLPLSGLAAALGGTVIGAVTGSQNLVATLVLSFLPVIAGIVLAVAGRGPSWRGFGLGLAIGWAIWVIVLGGACVGLIVLFSQGGFS